MDCRGRGRECLWEKEGLECMREGVARSTVDSEVEQFSE